MPQPAPRIPIRQAPAADPRPVIAALAQTAPPWRTSLLLEAPHRLGFFLGMLVLISAGAWWAAVQIDRITGWIGMHLAVPSPMLHGALMVWGFMPLLFSGFLFTAGPKWLHVHPLPARNLLAATLLQATGWLLWMAGGHWRMEVAAGGLAMALTGLGWMSLLWWRLVRASTLEDRLHAKTIGWALAAGCLSLAALLAFLLAGQPAYARAAILTALWGFIVVVFVSVAHRMIPFFTSSAVPLVQVWRPFWVLWLMLGAALFEVLALWAETWGMQGATWWLARSCVELPAGAMLLWLAVRWGVVQSLRIRLLAMLHLGFVWLGIAYVLQGLAQWQQAWPGALAYGPGSLGALHALTMGCLGSLVLAMVTRVSCGHSGRALIADNRVWALFWLLQLAAVLRLLAAVQGAPAMLMGMAAILWLVATAAWALRYMGWYGKPRVDGKPG